MLIFVERRGGFNQLVKSSKNKRQARQDEMNVDKEEKKLEDIIERQSEEIDDLKRILDKTKFKMDNHQRDNDYLKTCMTKDSSIYMEILLRKIKASMVIHLL